MKDECRAEPFREPAENIQSCSSKGERSVNGSGQDEATSAAVADYITYHRARAAQELEHYRRDAPSDEEAVSQAALGKRPDGKRHAHQRRVPRNALEQSQERLLANMTDLRQAECFDELFETIDALIRPIRGVGELTVYDTALRIGARFDLEPSRVYLHAGSREGARALGLDSSRPTLEIGELPPPIDALAPREVEDFLCIYKAWLGTSGPNSRPVSN